MLSSTKVIQTPIRSRTVVKNITFISMWKTSFVLHHIPSAKKPLRYPSKSVEKERPWLCVGKDSLIIARMCILLAQLKKKKQQPKTMITVKREKYQYLRQTEMGHSSAALPVSFSVWFGLLERRWALWRLDTTTQDHW